jgi:hypothetical protein
MSSEGRNIQQQRRQVQDLTRVHKGVESLGNANPLHYGTMLPKKYNLRSAVEEVETAGRSVSTDPGREFKKIDVNTLLKKYDDDIEALELDQFRTFLIKSHFPDIDTDPSSKVLDWTQKHNVYEWDQYVKMFPEMLSPQYNRAMFALEMNALFAKIAIHQRIRTRQEFILLYLYSTTPQFQDMVQPFIIEDLLRVREDARRNTTTDTGDNDFNVKKPDGIPMPTSRNWTKYKHVEVQPKDLPYTINYKDYRNRPSFENILGGNETLRDTNRYRRQTRYRPRQSDIFGLEYEYGEDRGKETFESALNSLF